MFRNKDILSAISQQQMRPLKRLAIPALLILLWQSLTSLGVIPAAVLASPLRSLEAGWALASSGALGDALWLSLRRSFSGLALGAAAGLAAGVVAGYWSWGENLIDANMQMLRAVPFVALAPVFIAWFGIGEGVKVAIIAFATLFPVYVGTYEGIRGLDRGLLEVARVTGMRTWDTVREIIVPGALASILQGFRYALTLSVIALVIAEQINVTGGLGALAFDARKFMQTDVLALCLLLYALLGVAANALARTLERRLLAWRREVHAV
ncbi:ABC transporter permease subunit [Xenophilus sp. Marseille-Q4582]|uniref:ABC transporter permease subunit n=1 Tax=Xenophilus sp. Marseille-Q4582 TaxID=2866600 RepID=UPI001CE3D868|nr:ABC transporter permease subunit [Xenophilus sp. Marseille-Q4582]